MGDFKKLIVWQRAHTLALHSHRAASHVRGPKNASLRNQMTRAAQSIPANIVEGRSQRSERDFGRFLSYALASAAELEYHLITARDTRALPPDEVSNLLTQLTEVRKMLHGLLSRLPAPPPN